MSGRCHRRGRVKPPNILIPHGIVRHDVFNTIHDISRICDDINGQLGRDKECIPTVILDGISNLSALLREEILELSLPAIPLLEEPLKEYKLILLDINHILSLDKPLVISHDTIYRRLDGCELQFREALDRLEGTVNQKISTSANFFPNAHHFNILGGTFNANPVVHDPVLHEECHKILKAVYFQCGVLFA